MPEGLALLLAALAAGLMGFAIQRGATCAVAAVVEVVGQRRCGRLLALVEAAAWVTGGLLVLQACGLLPQPPAGVPLSGRSVLGGALLGLGAVLNRACAFGSIARLGAGEWAYLATPLGFYLGCLGFAALPALRGAAAEAFPSPVLQAPGWVALACAAGMLLRLAAPMLGAAVPARVHELAGRVWSPHGATTVIGLSFLCLLVVAGAWSFTDLLAELATGMAGRLPARAVLLLALLAGAVFGGWSAGRLRAVAPGLGQVVRCLAGGAVMAWGAMLAPGGNDSLILVGMPLLWPYAWVAFAAMCLTIALAELTARRLAGREIGAAASLGRGLRR